jgi:hypothetical protein
MLLKNGKLMAFLRLELSCGDNHQQPDERCVDM